MILKGKAPPAVVTPASRAAWVARADTASQMSLVSELERVGARAVDRFSLVNSVAATVSALEAKRLAADPAVAQVIPDTPFSVPGPASASPAPAAQGHAGAARTPRAMSRHLNDIPGACAPTGRSQLAPEGLYLTGTASAAASAVTARSLGFTGAGVKVGYIADGVDPGNVNFRRPDGTSVFADYKDFSGNGVGAPTGGAEAFLDANTLAGQGRHVYDVNGFSAQSYAGSTCDVRIEGVAPGASLVGLDVFSGDPSDTLTTTASTFASAINYAVEDDRVNVLTESFGSNALPDGAKDVIKLFDDAAVRAGVVVTASTGDGGSASTISSPATDPNVISVGASTQFKSYAQADFGGARYFATKGWLSNNVSAMSSAGYDEAGGTVDMLAPGDLSWASCDASTDYSQCTNALGNPSAIEEAGGTSESAPFVSGAAALVIQAFRKTHGGRTPTPAQVKQILLATATDIGAPAQEQGAGLLNSAKAVQLALSYGLQQRTGSTLLSTPGPLTAAAAPGTQHTWRITVANEGTRTQAVSLAGRSLNPALARSASGAVTLNDATSGEFETDEGLPDDYGSFTFQVPPRQARLDTSIAYPADPTVVLAPPELILIAPNGRFAADSLPQGVGNYGNADVRAPAAGTWTGIIAGPVTADGGFTGKVLWRAVMQADGPFGSVSPSLLTLAPGQAKSVTFTATTPATAGDAAGSLVLSSSLNGTTSIPVVLRSQIDVAAGGAFAGDLTGGDGRGALGAADYYQFTVPAGEKQATAELKLANNPGIGDAVGAYLVSPDGNVAGYGQNTDLSQQQAGATGAALAATVLRPAPGTWTLIVAFAEPVAGTELSDPYSGTVSFAAAGTESAPALPWGQRLTPGTQVAVPVRITNDSSAPQDYFLDPRLDVAATVALAPVTYDQSSPFAGTSARSALPVQAGEITPWYFVPSHTARLALTQSSSLGAVTDLSPITGSDPDVGVRGLAKGSLCGLSATESYAPPAADVTSGLWAPAPSECGPFGGQGARAGSATDELSAVTAAFDGTATAATADFERLAVSAAAGNAALRDAVQLQPGQTAVVTVTFKAAGPAGSKHAGTLYLDTIQSGVTPFGQQSADEVAALPYSYAIG